MKANSFFSFGTSVVLTLAGLFSFTSCASFDEPGTGISIKMKVSVSDTDFTISNLSASEPFHVIAYAREKKCTPWYKVFEDNAYADGNGNLIWSSGSHEWPGQHMKFVAYWPADSSFVVDEEGYIIDTDCQLFTISDAVCHETQDITISFFPFNQEED